MIRIIERKLILEDYTDDPEYKELLNKLSELNKKDKELTDKMLSIKYPSDEEMRIACGYDKEEWKEFTRMEKETDYDLFVPNPERDKIYSEYTKIKEEIKKVRDRLDEIKEDYFKNQGGNTFKDNPPQKSTKDSYEGFKLDTGEYHQDYLDNPDYAKSKGYTNVYISEMTPDEYIERCAKEIFKDSIEGTKRGMEDPENVHEYADLIKNGTKFYMPYLDLKIKGQEGRHRALAAKEAGIDIIPVLYLY